MQSNIIMNQPRSSLNETTKHAPKGTPYWDRVRHEASSSHSLFTLREPDGTVLDVANTFSSQPHKVTAVVRLLLCLGAIAHISYFWLVYFPSGRGRFIYWAYFTRWCLLLTLSYQASAAIVTLWPSKFLKQPADNDSPTPHFLVKFMWIIYSAQLPCQLFACLAFWGALGGIGHLHPFEAVMDHGGFLIFVLLDGLVCHKLPIRIKHVALTYVIYFCFFVFYLIYDLTSDLGNGYFPHEPEDDTSRLYEQFNFTTSLPMGILVFTGVPVVVIPPAFALFWSLSLYNGSGKWDGSARHFIVVEDDNRISKCHMKPSAGSKASFMSQRDLSHFFRAERSLDQQNETGCEDTDIEEGTAP